MKYFTGPTVRALMLAVALSITPAAHAADYPNRDITFINPYAPGASTDPLSRKFTELLEKVMRVNINVENKPGGSATIGTTAVVLAKPDGYTIGLTPSTAVAYQPLINSKLAYKTPDDYQPILKLVEMPCMFVVRSDAPWKTFEEFMADVRKRPGKIRVSCTGKGATSDLVVQILNKVAGVRLVSVPFTGGGAEGLIALLAGRVEVDNSKAPTALGHVQAGKIRVLGVFKKGKYDAFPNAESVVDAGYDVTLPTVYSVIGPKGMPKDVLNKLVASSMEVARSDEFQKFTKAMGFVLDLKGPEALKEELVREGKTYSDLIKSLKEK
jgi:tripartite-type tricarboxylate transporter receptor subunit TctC